MRIARPLTQLGKGSMSRICQTAMSLPHLWIRSHECDSPEQVAAHLMRFCHVGAKVSTDLTRDSMSPLAFQLSELTGSFNSESTMWSLTSATIVSTKVTIY
jgi:hypothetical protein